MQSAKTEWTATTGQKLAAWVTSGFGSFWWHASIDGVQVHGGTLGPETNPPEDLKSLGVVACIGRVCLKAEQYESVKAALAALKDEFSKTPHYLAQKRDSLSDDVAAAYSELDDLREAAFAADVGNIPTTTDALEKARAALAEFDAAHPEVKAEKDAAKDAAVQKMLSMED